MQVTWRRDGKIDGRQIEKLPERRAPCLRALAPLCISTSAVRQRRGKEGKEVRGEVSRETTVHRSGRNSIGIKAVLFVCASWGRPLQRAAVSSLRPAPDYHST